MRVRLFVLEEIGVDGFPRKRYRAVANAWARVEPPTGRDLERFAGTTHTISAVITLHADAPVSEGGMIRVLPGDDGMQDYRIQSVLPRRMTYEQHVYASSMFQNEEPHEVFDPTPLIGTIANALAGLVQAALGFMGFRGAGDNAAAGVAQAASGSMGFIGVASNALAGVGQAALGLSVFRNIVAFGDSITQGYGAGGPTGDDDLGWVNLTRGVLQRSAGGNRGRGLIAAFHSQWWTYAGTWVSTTGYGPFGLAFASNTPGSTATFLFPVVGSDFDIYYVKDTTTAAFTVQIDSETPVTVGGSNSTPMFAKTNVASTVGSGAHTVTITAPASGYVIFWGVAANTGPTGVRVHNVSLSGLDSASAAQSGSFNGLTGWLASLAPDLTILGFGSNDFAESQSIEAFTANTTTLITAAKALGDVAIIATNARGDFPTGHPLQSEYVSALAALAASTGAVFYVDILNRWGGTEATADALGFMYTDHIHPSAAGYADMAVAIEAALGAHDPVVVRPTYGITTHPSCEYDASTLPALGYTPGGAIALFPDATGGGLDLVRGYQNFPHFAVDVFPTGAARFNSANTEAMRNTAWPVLSGVAKYELFLVFRASGALGHWCPLVITGSGGVDPQIIYYPGEIDLYMATAAIGGAWAWTADTNKHVLLLQYDGAQATDALRCRVSIDGVPLSLFGFNSPIPSVNGVVTSIDLGNSGAFDGHIPHMLTYAGAAALSDADAATVLAALRAKYGI